jgi:hypothetical protein
MNGLTPVEIKRTEAPTKRYFARVAGSRFVCPHCGDNITFFFGKVDITIKECQDQLDYLVKVGNPMIYTQDIIPKEVLAIDKDVEEVKNTGKSEAEVSAAEAAIRNAGLQGVIQQEVGKITADAGLPTSADKSTLDPTLAATFMATKKPGQPVSGSGMTKVHKA